MTLAALEQYFAGLAIELNLWLLGSAEYGRDRMLWVENIVLTRYEEPLCADGHKKAGLSEKMKRAAGHVKHCLAKIWEKVQSLRP